MHLGEARAAIVDEIQEGLTIVASGYPVGEIGETLDALSSCFQALAICQLLDGDTTRFRENLARSGLARRYFLRKSAEENNLEDRRLALSRNDAFFDALGGGQGQLAREIATASIDKWHEAWEYEDDFHYFLFLHRLLMVPRSLGTEDSLILLQRYEKAANGLPASRGAVLKALVGHDQPAFGDALRSLMRERDHVLQERKAKLSEPDLSAYLHWPRTFICLEGLALIAIGRAFRLETHGEVPMCPTIARVGFGAPAVEDPFLSIEIELKKAGG
jgi:hypothetical protein